jgi:hypothetical protein
MSNPVALGLLFTWNRGTLSYMCCLSVTDQQYRTYWFRIQICYAVFFRLEAVLRIASHWCGSGDPDPDRHFDADPDPDPSFQIKAQNLEKLLNRLIFHTDPQHWLEGSGCAIIFRITASFMNLKCLNVKINTSRTGTLKSFVGMAVLRVRDVNPGSELFLSLIRIKE